MVEKAQIGNWDEDFSVEAKNNTNTENNSKKLVYMTFKKSGNYRIRLVGDYIKCRKHFKPYVATVQDTDKEIDPAWKAGFFPSRRYAINIIDKTDLKPGEVGTLKILEKGTDVFKHFRNYKTVFNVDPASKEGPDFNINVEISDPNDPLSTEYSVMPLEKAPFTKEEIQMIKEAGGLYKLRDIYHTTSAEKMQEMWDALPDEKKIPPKKKENSESKTSSSTKGDKKTEEEPTNKKIEENMKDAPSENNEDVFGENNTDENTDDNTDDKSSELF